MRLFPSKENWRRYKWVTKIGIVGAYASIISGTYIVSQLILSPLINKELVTNKDLQTDIGGLRGQLTEINEKLGEEINDFDTISYPGYSIDLMVSLNRNMSNHPAYIFDRGNSTEKERLSLYVNKYNELCYRLIDSSGEIYTITINENNAGISLGKLVFIACEYGEIGNHSFQRLVINGTEVGRINFTRNLNLTNRIKLVGSTYGADMNGKFCSCLLYTSPSPRD